MEDPLEYVESLDESVIEYAIKESELFSRRYGNSSKALRDGVYRYYSPKRALSVKVTKAGVMESYVKEGKYHISLGGKDIYTTDNLIFWFDADPDGNRVAVFETQGSDRGKLTILKEGRSVESMEGKFEGLKFTRDSYYLTETFSDRSPPDGGELNSHRVMKDGGIVFGTGLGVEDFIDLYSSGDEMFVVVGNWSRSEIFRGHIEDPKSWKSVRKADHEMTPLGVREGRAYYLDHTGNGVIKREGTTLIESTTPVNSAVLVKEGILLIHMVDAKAEPVLYDNDGMKLKAFGMDKPMGLKHMDSDGNKAVLAMESFGIPYSQFALEGDELVRTAEIEAVPVDIVEEFADSSGAKVHYFMVSTEKQSCKGVLAYGYGGFNIPVVPMYYPSFAYLLSRGIGVAVANLRGGNEYGEDWHRDGMLLKKQNVFNDFQSVIKKVRKGGSKVVAFGVSNGGLLVGATLTQAPEILDGAVIGNPVLDMMRFHKMSVGRFWVPEFGDPDNPGEAEYLFGYSPYHNIGNRKYPNTLIYTRLKDDRVHPAHAIKFHMRLKEKLPEANLRANPVGGHIGLTAEESVSEISDICAFVLKCLQDGTEQGN